MNRFFTLLIVIILGSLIAGLYGIIHDELTYTISPEYYTKFKFEQFGLYWLGENIGTGKTSEIIPAIPRLGVAIVGFLATWWMGLIIGLILGLSGLAIKQNTQFLKTILKAFWLTLIIAFITGLIGLFYGNFLINTEKVNWFMPDNLIDKKNFISVGSMHNFSYLGGLVGLVAGVFYIRKQRKKLNSN